jgi:hypothetical protein
MRRLFLLVPIAIVVVFALASAAGALRPAVVPGPRVQLQPGVVELRERATIAVTGIHARSLEVLLAGASAPLGDQPARQLPWLSLRLVDGVWRGLLPAPALRGVYPVVLRTGAGATPVQHSLLRVFAPGTGAQPSFRNPADVARWWVRTAQHAKLVALKPWPRPGFDLRDTRLHRIFVVAYSPPGHPRIRDRMGMFVTAVRDGYGGRWRLLEATLEP